MRPLVACIDDDPFVREALEGLLRSIGLAALIFGSAEEFLNWPNIGQVTLLITDIKLGGISGLELLKQLAVEHRDMPAIVVTAFGDDLLRQQSLAAGALGFLNKPIHEADLLTLIEMAHRHSSP